MANPLVEIWKKVLLLVEESLILTSDEKERREREKGYENCVNQTGSVQKQELASQRKKFLKTQNPNSRVHTRRDGATLVCNCFVHYDKVATRVKFSPPASMEYCLVPN